MNAPPRITVSQYIAQQIAICGRTQKHIARDCGFASANMVTYLKKGKCKVPLAKLGVLAVAIDADPALLLRLALQEYDPKTWAVVASILDGDNMLTRTERTLIRHLRDAQVCEPIDMDDPGNLRCLSDALRSIASTDRAKAAASIDAAHQRPRSERQPAHCA